MTKDEIEMIPWEVIGDVYRNMGVDIDDDGAIDNANRELATLEPWQILEKYLTWNGIIGYGKQIWKACEMLRDD